MVISLNVHLLFPLLPACQAVQTQAITNSEIESMKEKIKYWEKSLQEKTVKVERKLQEEIERFRDEKLYMEVYQ